MTAVPEPTPQLRALADLARRIVDKILDDLEGRSGFDHWWGNIDATTQREIRRTLASIARHEIEETS